ncbi:hypothetical protein H4R21_001409 [Coemansia helicoidea]|uniref:Uncharacterized protein n=1 Tax=Coemansia helicoidea TaxID=1286919 RepID=A0ACC1LBS4_9FUNG|nr:hypothetical protein H4R21_001409 [Coemansia helicoidea]
MAELAVGQLLPLLTALACRAKAPANGSSADPKHPAIRDLGEGGHEKAAVLARVRRVVDLPLPLVLPPEQLLGPHRMLVRELLGGALLAALLMVAAGPDTANQLREDGARDLQTGVLNEEQCRVAFGFICAVQEAVFAHLEPPMLPAFQRSAFYSRLVRDHYVTSRKGHTEATLFARMPTPLAEEDPVAEEEPAPGPNVGSTAAASATRASTSAGVWSRGASVAGVRQPSVQQLLLHGHAVGGGVRTSWRRDCLQLSSRHAPFSLGNEQTA